jgi:EAL domain
MTQWILATAFQQIKKWSDEGRPMRLSINVSARNLEEEDFAQLLSELIVRYGIRPEDIELEFTESALIRFKTLVLDQLVAIRGMGVGLAIDDFGTGYSSFAYLRQLPATTVKLDQSFMHALADNKKDESMVRSMIAMAKDIGYRVVAYPMDVTKFKATSLHVLCPQEPWRSSSQIQRGLLLKGHLKKRTFTYANDFLALSLKQATSGSYTASVAKTNDAVEKIVALQNSCNSFIYLGLAKKLLIFSTGTIIVDRVTVFRKSLMPLSDKRSWLC